MSTSRKTKSKAGKGGSCPTERRLFSKAKAKLLSGKVKVKIRVSKAPKFAIKQNADGSFSRIGRPEFMTAAKKVPAGEVGGIKLDRRHIIPSNVLTDSLAGYLTHNPNRATYTAAMDQFIQNRGKDLKFNKSKPDTLENKLTKIAQYIHSHPGNLFPGRGDWNQAIGRLAQQVKNLVVGANAFIEKEMQADLQTLYDQIEKLDQSLENKVAEIESATDNAVKTRLDKEKSDLEAEIKKVDQEIINKTQTIDQKALSYMSEKLKTLDSSPQGKEILETATKYIDQQGTSFARVRNFLEDSLIPSLDYDFYTSEYDEKIAVDDNAMDTSDPADDNAMDTSDEESKSSIEKKITEKPLTPEAKKWVVDIQKKSLEFYVKLTQFRDQGYYIDSYSNEHRDYFQVIEDFLKIPKKPDQTSASTSTGPST